MNPSIQTILWCIAGIVGVVGVVGVVILRKSKGAQNPTDQPQHPIPQPNPLSTELSTPPSLPVSDDNNEITRLSAKEAFLRNVDKFEYILPQLNDKLNIESWSEQIVDINNPQLIELCKRCLKNVGVWKQMLSSWGLRQDTCKTFTYLDKYANMYACTDGKSPEDGCKYRVIDGCWILTNDNNGEKRVIRKGLIEKI